VRPERMESRIHDLQYHSLLTMSIYLYIGYYSSDSRPNPKSGLRTELALPVVEGLDGCVHQIRVVELGDVAGAFACDRQEAG
jgi:hypothetical protein